MKIYKLFTVAIISVFFMSACWSTETANIEENINSSNTVSNETANEKAENTGDNIDYAKLPETSNTSMSPTETVMAFNKANFSKDAEKIKSFLSQSSLRLIEETAKIKNKTVDEILTNDNQVKDEKPVIRNEKINGDTATVEIQNVTVKEFYNLIPFVKEDGIWKVALDKIDIKEEQERLMQQLDAETKNQNQAPDSKSKNP